MSASVTCPVNGCDLRAGEIPQEYLAAGLYGPWNPDRGPWYYSRIVGIEVRSVYDGVLYWKCPTCGAAWQRFETIPELREKAQPYIDKANASVTA